MKFLARLSALFAFLVLAVDANTEKVIFVASPSISNPKSLPHLHNFKLDVLGPSNLKLRKSLPVAFPTEKQLHGIDSWYLLKSLNEGQRYEVRICWAAIQPTDFWLDIFKPQEVVQNSELLHSLDVYTRFSERAPNESILTTHNYMLLRVQSAADFYTSNRTLMLDPPLVDVDIILDQYLANIFPSSLVPTAVYIIVLAIGSWFLSGFVWSRLSTPGALGKKLHPE